MLGSSMAAANENDGGTLATSNRKKRKRPSASKLKSGVLDWANDVPWKDVTPSDPLAVLVGSDEGGFVCLEEFEGDLQVEEDHDHCFRARVHRTGRKKQKESSKGTEDEQHLEAVELGDALSPESKVAALVADEMRQKGENGSQKREPKTSTRRKKKSMRDTQKKQQETDIGSMDGHIDSYQSTEELEGGVSFAQNVEDPIEQKAVDLSAWVDLRLHSKLERALATLGFTQPTPIQKACIPAAAHKGKDVIGAAETGSGKTLSYAIPILQRLLEEEDKISMLESCNRIDGGAGDRTKGGSSLRALIITPTRELALQVCDHFRAAAMYTGIKVVAIVGGMAMQKQQRFLKQRPQAVVATPGRLWELMSAGESHLIELHLLSFLVLDEADRMVEKGHFQELQSILDMLPSNQERFSLHKQRILGRQSYDGGVESKNGTEEGLHGTESAGFNRDMSCKRRQTFVFSATLALPPGFRKKLKKGVQESNSATRDGDCSVAMLSERAGVRHNAAIVNLTTKNIVANKLEESVIECREDQKDSFLYYILKMHGCGRAIVFCTSIAAVRRVSALMKILQVSVWPLHAQMQQKQRLKAMDRFRSSEDSVLVATDVAARGLDIVGVRSVIHYQLPHSAEVYVHRSGRTARASSDGCSILLVSPPDRRKYSVLCHALSKENGLPPFPIKTDYMLAVENRVHLAHQVDQLSHKNTQVKANKNWLKRNAEALEIDIDDDIADHEENGLIKARHLTSCQLFQLNKLQKELEYLLEQPLKPRSLSQRFIAGAGLSSFVAQQLQDYASSKQNKTRKRKSTSAKVGCFNEVGKSRNRLVVIGQEAMEPLTALRARVL